MEWIAGAGLLGSIITAATMHGDAQSTNAENAWQAQLNRKFQADMSNTAHQRDVADLKAAGLNPLLSANAGSSTPSGAQAVMQQTHLGDQAAMQFAVQTAIQAQKTGSDMELQRKQGDLMNAQQANTEMDTVVKSKGVPEADLKNKLYNILKPFIPTANQKQQSNAPKSDPKGFLPMIPQVNPRALGLP